MVRAADFDALKEWAWSKEGVEYHERMKTRKQRYKGKSNT